MVPRIWLARFLCRDKPYHRVMTAEFCSPLGRPPIGCSRLRYFTPQPGEEGERICLKLDSMRADAEDHDSRADAEEHDSRADAEEHDSRTLLNSASVELSDYSSPLNDHNVYEMVSARTAGSVSRRSSGLGAVFPLQRTRTSCSVGITLTRSLSSNGTRTESQLSDDEDKKLSPFKVVLGDNGSLLHKINAAIEDKKHEFTDDAMKERYKKHVRPQLSCRGLILPENLQHDSTKFVHFRTKEIVGRRPMYMSVLDVMGHEKRMKPDEWQSFLKYMVKARIFVIEKWDSSLSHMESLMYDFGIIAPDVGTNVEFYKGECDAAYDGEKKLARLSFLIFKGTSIIRCQVYHALPCESSVVAEAYAAAALLMTAQELGMKKMVLWTDCEATHGVLSGERNVKLKDEHLGVFMMLREQMKGFDRVIPMWKGRELNLFADELCTLDKEETLHPSFPWRAMVRWKLQLEGSPVFRFKQKREVTSVIKNFVDNEFFGRGAATSAAMLHVEQVCKFDILLGLQDGFNPDDLYVAVHEFRKKPQDLQSKIVEFFGEQMEFVGKPGAHALEGVTFFHWTDFQNKKQGERKALMVLFDANLWGKSFHASQLTLVLISPGEAESIARRNLRKLTALDYARFSRIK